MHEKDRDAEHAAQLTRRQLIVGGAAGLGTLLATFLATYQAGGSRRSGAPRCCYTRRTLKAARRCVERYWREENA